MCFLEQRDRLARRGPRLQRLLDAVVAAPTARTDIPLQMLWFVNERADRSRRIGLRCHQENGTYVVTVVDPDGSETQTTFDNEDSMTAEAVRIHLGLEHRGWRALPRIE